MIAVVCPWGGDLAVGPTGDLLTETIESELPRKLTRRLLTNAGDYLWQTQYGAGLGRYVGDPFSAEILKKSIYEQILREPLIANVPGPVVLSDYTDSSAGPMLSLTIKYQLATTAAAESVSLTIERPKA